MGGGGRSAEPLKQTGQSSLPTLVRNSHVAKSATDTARPVSSIIWTRGPPPFEEEDGGDAGIRLDHILLSHGLVPKLNAAGVDRHVRGYDKSSDHAPTWVELAY